MEENLSAENLLDRQNYIRAEIRKRNVGKFTRFIDASRIIQWRSMIPVVVFCFVLFWSHLLTVGIYEILFDRFLSDDYDYHQVSATVIGSDQFGKKIRILAEIPGFKPIAFEQNRYKPAIGQTVDIAFVTFKGSSSFYKGCIYEPAAVWDSIVNDDFFWFNAVLPVIILFAGALIFLPRYIRFRYLKKNNMYVEVTATGKFECKLNYTVVSPYEYLYVCLFRDYAELEMADPGFPAVYFRGPFVCFNIQGDRRFADNSRYKYRIYMRDLHNPKDQVYFLEVIRNDGVVVRACH